MNASNAIRGLMRVTLHRKAPTKHEETFTVYMYTVMEQVNTAYGHIIAD